MKTYVLDTNIILDSPDNLITLSDNGTNTIVIPEIVIDELDSKKSGFDDINYNARQFARMLEDSTITNQTTNGTLSLVTTEIPTLDIKILIISKASYDCESSSIATNILNDRKILELTKDYQQVEPSTILVSLDIMCRTRSISLGIPAESLVGKQSEITYNFHKTITVPTFNRVDGKPITDIDPDYQPDNFSYTLVNAETGQEGLFYVVNDHIYKVDEAELGRQAVKPINKEQKFFVNSILSSYTDIVTIDAKAGSGKTLLALASAMHLVKKKQYGSIIYIRNSIESVAKGEDVGYLPGMEEKFAIYNHPLYDSLRFIAKSMLTKSNNNKSKANATPVDEEAITAKVAELSSAYNIQTMWVGEMRGRTISNALVIIDEFQNCSASTGQLILSRLDKDCKAICIGSNKQIDNMYTNKYINALSTLLKATKNKHNINLFAGELNKVVRGPITQFAEEVFSK